MDLSKTEKLQPSQPVEFILTKYGWMFCAPGDQYVTGSLRRWGVYSECEAIILQQLVRNRTVLMAGGHTGSIAVPIAQSASYTTVYEPQPLLAKLCEANLAVAGLSHKSSVNNAALGAEAGFINIPVLRLDSQYNMGCLGKSDWGKGTQVRMDNINTLLADNQCNFMLLDVEGMELEILQAVKPDNLPELMWVECDRREGGKLIQYLNDNNFSTYWMINPLTPNQVRPDSGPWPMQASFNLLCVKSGLDWPLEGIPQFVASPSDSMGNCTPDKIIWNLSRQ